MYVTSRTKKIVSVLVCLRNKFLSVMGASAKYSAEMYFPSHAAVS